MTYIPDVRKKIITKPFAKEAEENYYWEGYLDAEDKKWLKGYDFAAEDVLNSIFDNIGDLSLQVEGEDIDLGLILNNHPEIRAKLREAIAEEYESTRDELVTVMIDGYSQEKYDQLKKVADVIHKVEEDSIQERSEGKA